MCAEPHQVSQPYFCAKQVSVTRETRKCPAFKPISVTPTPKCYETREMGKSKVSRGQANKCLVGKPVSGTWKRQKCHALTEIMRDCFCAVYVHHLSPVEVPMISGCRVRKIGNVSVAVRNKVRLECGSASGALAFYQRQLF